jgi:threonine/homoserine/homoserine lactone efflux protein
MSVGIFRRLNDAILWHHPSRQQAGTWPAMQVPGISLHTYLLFLPACFALNMAFGPNNLLSLSNGARSGALHSVGASIGRLLAFTLMISITGCGLGTLLLASEPLFAALKYAGAAYLAWIGIRLLRSRPVEQRVLTATGATEDRNRGALLKRHFRQEFYVAATNPKAILIFTAFFPQFIDRMHYAGSFARLGATFLVLEFVAIVIYAVIGARLRSFTANPGGLVWLNRTSGALMIGFGVVLSTLRQPAV